MKRIIVIAAALALAGIGWFLWRGGEGKNTAETTQPAVPAASVTKPKPKRMEPKRTDRDDRTASQAMSVLLDDDPAGALRLEGQVVDDNKDGVPGAVVIIDSNPPRQVKAESDGSFFFDRLVGRRYSLIARSSEGVAGPVSAELTATSEPVVLTLRAAGSVQVTVMDAVDKTPIANATVELRGMDVQTETTDVAGRAVIRPVVADGYWVVAHAPGHAKQHSRVRVPASRDRVETEIYLRRGAAVNGRVVSPDGEPVVGAAVLYSGASEWAQQADPRQDSATTDKNGTFRFEALPVGTFRFTARDDSHAPGSSELVTLDGVTETSDIVIAMEPAAVIVGRVETVNGEPVSSARVRVTVKVDSFFRGRIRQAYSDERGAFEIQGLPRKSLQVVAAHEDGSSQIVEVDMKQAPHEREVSLRLENTDVIAGIVVDSEGEPVDGAQVFAFPDFSKGARIGRGSMQLRGFPTTLSDPAGQFSMRGMEPGAYEVRASPPGSSSRGFGGLRESVSANTGDTDVRIVMPADGSIKGKVALPDGSAPDAFTINLGGFRGATPFASKDGSFQLFDVPPQTYTLSIRGVGFDTKQVTSVDVQEGQEKDLGTIQVSRGRFIAGRVMRDGQPAPDTRVRAGRVVFGDGTSIEARFGGPPGARNTKETTTDENGEFTISGVGGGDISVVAENETLGRSRAVLVLSSTEPTTGIELSLLDVGALQGKISQDSESASTVIVSLQARSAYGLSFGVSTGTDGTYRFDRLAPDMYKISAMIGTPFTGMNFYSDMVEVLPNQTVEKDLGIDGERVSLIVTLKPTNTDKVNFAFVRLASGVLSAATANELERAIAATEGGFSSFAFSFGGQPATIDNIPPGAYSVCATPYPNELGRREFGSYIEREGDRMPVFCQAVTVAPAQAQQSLDLAIEVPAFVPAEGEGQSPDGDGDPPSDGEPPA